MPIDLLPAHEHVAGDSAMLRLPITEMFRIDQDYGCINVVERNGGRPWVRLANGTPADLAAASACLSGS
jgi:hypothetical protein